MARAQSAVTWERLSLSGQDVTLITRRFTAETINANGLSLTEAGQTTLTRPRAVASIPQAFMDDSASYDLIIMSMKAYDLLPALDPLIAFYPQPPTIIAVQNGIGVEQPLIEQFGRERIIAASLTTPISKETQTRLVVNREDRGLGLAPTQRRQDIKRWVQLFENAEISTVSVSDYQAMKWSKALLNIVGNATSAILNRAPGIVYKSSAMFELEIRMMREAMAVMEKLNLKIIDLPGSPASRLATGVRRVPQFILKGILTHIVDKGRGGKMPSFHADLAAGKGKNEVEYHNGAIAQVGKANGVSTPINQIFNDVLMKLAREEVDWREFDGKPKRLLVEVKRYQEALKRER